MSLSTEAPSAGVVADPVAVPPAAAPSGARSRRPAAGASAIPSKRSGRRRRPAVWAFPLYLLLQIAQLGVLRLVAPRFFYFDDAQIQFTPMTWWLGNNFGGGMPPLLDPDQGMSANITADMQYGVFDVVRWPFMLLAGRQDNLLDVATEQAWLAVLVLGTAALSVLLQRRVHPVLAVAAALGVTSSGFFLWWGSAWSPVMWSMATLVWLWAALASRRWWGPIGVGLAAAAAVCSGNPYILPVLPFLVLAQCWERWRELGRGMLRDRRTIAQVVALVAGAALAAPTLVNALDAAGWMYRPAPAYTVASAAGETIPNLLDVLTGGFTVVNTGNVPMYNTLVFAVPVVVLVAWRQALRRPQVLTALVMTLVPLVLTQMPTYVLGFRFPFRLMPAAQIFLGLGVVLAFTAARRITRGRVALAIAVILLQGYVAVVRAPVMWHWHVISVVVTALAVTAVLLFVSPGARFAKLLPDPLARPLGTRLTGLLTRRWVRPVAALGVLLLALAPLVGQLRMSTVIQQRYEAFVPHAGHDGGLYRGLTDGTDVGTTVEATRENAFATDASLSVYPFGAFGDPDDRGWRLGVMGGNANLVAGLRPGYGSLAVWPKGVHKHLEADYQNGLAYSQPDLLKTPDEASEPWIELLSGNRVLLGLNSYVPDRLADYFADNWDLVYNRDGWKEYQRRDPMPGRVTMATDATVAAVGAEDGVAHAGEAFETYTVSTGDDEGRLVFRTPYWNGFRATLDGRPVEVSAFDDALLQVNLPAGVSSGTLKIYFEPIAARILPACVTAGGVLLVVAVLVAVGRRPGRRGAGV